MEGSTGTGGMGMPYEYVIKRKETGTVKLIRVLLCILYALWTLGNLAVILLFKSILVLMVLVWISGLWLMIVLTWRRTYLEYEVSFFGGEMTVSRIYGSSSRKRLITVAIRDISSIFPYDDEHLPMIEKFRPTQKLIAISSADAPEIYGMLWKDKDDVRHLVCMEVNEKAIKNLRFHNAFAFHK